jgi:hypothetical protein
VALNKEPKPTEQARQLKGREAALVQEIGPAALRGSSEETNPETSAKTPKRKLPASIKNSQICN